MSETIDLDRGPGNGTEPYALATVVAVDRPVSAKPGDRATITSSGRVEGWIGGSCSEPIVVREAMAALMDGRARLVRIRPPEAPPERERPGVVNAITTCASEGGLDVFVEPRLPAPRLIIVGSSPISRALTTLADALGYQTTAALDDPIEDAPGAGSVVAVDDLARTKLYARDAVVVATMNRYDDVGLEAALQTEAGYIGLVASRARAQSVTELLRGRGVDAASIERVHSPAGLDLGPSTQEEIALAVMAEIVAESHRLDGATLEGPLHAEHLRQEAIDPVCGMTVAIVPDAISAEHAGVTYYFCGPACRNAMLADPDQYERAG